MVVTPCLTMKPHPDCVDSEMRAAHFPLHVIIIIIIMEICKAPPLRLKALNKRSITHMMYIEMEMLSAIKMYVRKIKEQANT